MQTIHAPAVTQGFRLSPQQQHLWRLRPGLAAQCAVEIAGGLDAGRLRRAVERCVERHEILRTTFHLLPGMTLPVQVVAERGAVDFTTRSGEGAVDALLAAERERPFDLASGPLLRTALIELAPARHLLLLTLPALIADGASVRLLAAEVAAGYTGAAPAAPEDEPLQYADVAEIFHEWLESGAEGAAFWARQDAALPPAIGGPAPEGLPYTPRSLSRPLGAERAAALEALAGNLGAPAWQLLLAAWQATLWHSMGEGEIVVGTVFDGRTVAEFESALGLFARVLPVRASLNPDATLGDLVSRLAAEVAAAAEWQDAFAPSATDWPAGFEHDGGAVALAPGFSVRGATSGAGPFGLLLSVRHGDGPHADLSYDPARFTASEAERLLGRFLRVLDGFLAEPDGPLAELEVLSEDERRELLTDFNRTASPAAAGWTAHALFEERARAAPDAQAVAWGDLRLTFAELDARANRLARHLRSLGVEPDSRVAICLERSAAQVEALFGVLKAGGAYVPLDPAYPADRLAYMLEDSGASVLLTQERLVPLLYPLTPAGTRLVRLDGEAPEARDIAAWSGEDPGPRATPENLAYVIYTSGSTGRPKGVMVPHRGLANYLVWAREATGRARGTAHPSTRPSASTSPSPASRPWPRGAASPCFPRSRGSAPWPPPSASPGVQPGQDHAGPPGGAAPGAADGRVRGRTAALVVGGEALWAESLGFWRENAPGTRLINEYGPTEATVGCCVHEVSADDRPRGRAHRPADRQHPPVRRGGGGCGRSAGAPGELWIGGHGLARGYLGRPDLTAERFAPDPLRRRAGRPPLPHGDLVRLLPSGGLEFLGRIDTRSRSAASASSRGRSRPP